MSLVAAASTQIQVVHALALRETRTRFGHHKMGYFWAIFEPVMWISTFYIIYTIMGRNIPNGMDVYTFVTTGFVPYLIFMHTVQNCSNAVGGNINLLWYPQVHVVDLIFARLIIEFATGTVVFVLLMIVHGVGTGSTALDNPLMVLTALALAALLGSGFGFCLAMIRVVWPTIDRIKGVMMRPLFWCSGLFYTAGMLPVTIREALLWNPILHVTELSRGAWFATYDDFGELSYAFIWILGFWFVALTLERSVRSRLHKQ